MIPHDPAGAREISVGSAAQYHDTRLYDNSWALVVGINQYRSENIPALQFAEQDAAAVAELLPSLGFPPENIRLLLASRGEVSRDQIQQVVERDLNRRMSRHDRLLVHFAGHGVSLKVWDRMSGYLLMPDSEISGELPTAEKPYLQSMPVGALEMRQFLDLLSNLPAKHKLLLIDTCFSGFMANSRAVEQVKINDARVPLWAEEPATHVLTAGRSGQKAFEDPTYQHGVFTWFVLQGLRGHADPRGDGLITFFDLANYVRNKVAALGRHQDPQAMAGEQDGVFMFINARIMERESARRQVEEQEHKRAAELARQEAERRAQEEAKHQAEDLARQEAEQRAQEEAKPASVADELARKWTGFSLAELAERQAQEEAKRQAEEQARQEAAELARQEGDRRAQEEAKRQAEDLELQRAAKLARQEAEQSAQEEAKLKAAAQEIGQMWSARLKAESAKEAAKVTPVPPQPPAGAKPASAKPTPPAARPAPARTPALPAVAPSSLDPSLGYRFGAFFGGALACFGCNLAIFAIHDFFGHSAVPAFGHQPSSPALPTYAVFLFIALGKGIHAGMTNETHNIFSIMLWPWAILTIVGLMAFGWDEHASVFAATYVLAGVLGFIQACRA